mmetsp:Transcript_20385/g.81516  ORF Transcript_20385/g.81516 Transcript_20385/m.81516 type:complete len:98 (+) Transcript_20385:2396-2689(+)
MHRARSGRCVARGSTARPFMRGLRSQDPRRRSPHPQNARGSDRPVISLAGFAFPSPLDFDLSVSPWLMIFFFSLLRQPRRRRRQETQTHTRRWALLQ